MPTTKPTSINLPLSSLKCLYKSKEGKSLVCEIDINDLQKINKPETIEEIYSVGRLEYFSGQTEGFTNDKEMFEFLDN